ncbi:MAG: hypothetical protein F6J96_35770 [Symploca sp. SIO1C2]|nr:hypothetical protein [Symploca sp. SIO1C2]
MSNRIIENLERVAEILASVSERFVFIGGATIPLYVDEILWDEVRPTLDVDCVVEVFTLNNYYALLEKLRAVGLEECADLGAPICRWRHQNLIVDVMPYEKEILGFSNYWYQEGFKNAIDYFLPSGRKISIFPPLYLLASKVEAFLRRGQDFRLSKDIEDIVTVLDGREVLEEEFHQARGEVKDFLVSWFRENEEYLQEPVLSFVSSDDRQDFVIDLITGV